MRELHDQSGCSILVAVMIWLCAIPSAVLWCMYWLARSDLRNARKQMDNFNPYYYRMCDRLAAADTTVKRMRAERNMWRDRWKQGAFELDAATMAKLAEDD
jgi:hypothetical protein